jgi:hypothetical protein
MKAVNTVSVKIHDEKENKHTTQLYPTYKNRVNIYWLVYGNENVQSDKEG